MKAQHTPLPWAQSDSQPHLTFRDAQGCIDVRSPVAMCNRTPEGLANAAFIVTACNNHDALVAMVSAFLSEQETLKPPYRNDALCEEATALLLRVEEL